MSTRKAIKKATKKVVAKGTKSARPVAVAAEPVAAPTPTPAPAPEHVVVAAPVQETFVTTPQPAPTETIPRLEVLVYVSGQSRGRRAHNNRPMAEFARSIASEFGIRTFSVYLDEVKANTSMGAMTMDNFGKLEIVPKDSRGKN